MEVWNIWSFLAASRQTSSFPWTRGDDVSSVSSLHVTGLDFGTSTDNWFAQPIWEFSLAGTLVDQGVQIETKNPFYPSWTCWRILRFRLENKDVFATLPVPPCGQGFFPPHKLLQENWNRFQTRLSNAAQSWRSHFFLNISGLHLLQAISRPNVWCWDWRVHPHCCGISRMVASMFWILGQKMESYRMIWDVRPEMLFRVVIGALFVTLFVFAPD